MKPLFLEIFLINTNRTSPAIMAIKTIRYIFIDFFSFLFYFLLNISPSTEDPVFIILFTPPF